MDIADVKKVASLARLSLSPEECQSFGIQMTAILDYVRLLDELDTTQTEPMPHAVELLNVFRSDQQRASLDRAAALSIAPQTDGQFFLVPRILEEKH